MIDYGEFAARSRTKWRFVPDAECCAFLDLVESTMIQRHCTYAESVQLYRAQNGCDRLEDFATAGAGSTERLAPHGRDRMMPRQGRACEGRANPKGISALYVATNPETAVAEVRPAVGGHVTVVSLGLKRALTLVDCSRVHDQGAGVITVLKTVGSDSVAKLWAGVDRAFATPVSATDSSADYAPTQIIAERVRSNGYDGIIYRSSLGPGNNIVLFDVTVADPIEYAVVTATDVTVAFKGAAGSPHWAHYRQASARARGNRQ